MLPEHIVSKIMSYVSHPVADHMSHILEECNLIRDYKCEECVDNEWLCRCAYKCPLVSDVGKLCLIDPPSYKMEKILELKVVMNWVVSKVGSHQVNPDLSMEKRIVYHRWLWGELQKKKRPHALSLQQRSYL